MKTVKYPKDESERRALKKRYIEALGKLKNKNGSNKLKSKQREWSKLRGKLFRTQLPADIEEILTAEYSELIKYYEVYRNAGIPEADKSKLEGIFSYSNFHDAIAEFFMAEDDIFDLRACHYCGMAYINKYTIDADQEGLDQLNQSDRKQLKKLLKIKNENNIQTVYEHRPYTSVEQFNNVVKWRSEDKFHSMFHLHTNKNHFDLDHVLPKDNCPITAISLMNFVPSCSVCNERLKRTKVLGEGDKPMEELSPTSEKFDFDKYVKFRVMPKSEKGMGSSPTKHANDYELEIKVENRVYEQYIQMFHLRERYQFHKKEALFWLELGYRYTNSRISMLAEALNIPENSERQIKSDIFQEFLDQQERCFKKLKKDILEQARTQ